MYKPSCWGKTTAFNGHVKTGNGKAGCIGPNCQKCAGINCDLPPTESPELIIVNNQTPVSGTIRKDAGIPGCKGNNCNDCQGGNCATVPPCVDDRNAGKEFTTVAETTVHEEATTAFVTTEKHITTETATTGATQKITTQAPTHVCYEQEC